MTAGSQQPPEAMDAARLSDLLCVMAPDRLGAHVAGLRAALQGIAGPGAPPLPRATEPTAWTGLARRAHAAAGHALLLGFPGIGGRLNALEGAAKRQDPEAAAVALAALREELAAGGPRLPPI
ncbi:hypothetical protein [Albimonas pacifica]|uniref:HPt domain-containing protein n=1 Tax=Albimonas pacifica TaxID=1114924 RepID=A0A1I3JT73_9RHOB|nr:hypothetical protein [Albimonas pacifica]SFI63145.1 hypothetical protein SAMN05216258_108134 [Albimonas pacifica]